MPESRASAGNEASAVLPQAKKRWRSAVARALPQRPTEAEVARKRAPTKRAPTKRAPTKRAPTAWLPLAVLLLALAVLALAWPRFQAAFRYLPVDRAIARYHAEREIPTNRLTVLIDFARQAIGHHDHYRFHDGLSQLHYLRGLDPYTPALERRPAYAEAEAEAVHSLQQAPAQPETWLRLATIRWILRDEPENIIAPWKMSVFTGRTHSALYAQRVELGLAHRAQLDEEALTMLRDQLLLAWKTHPGTLIQVLARRDRGLSATRGLLEFNDPAALQEMEAWLEKLR